MIQVVLDSSDFQKPFSLGEFMVLGTIIKKVIGDVRSD
jgi:hypothetical protein